MRKFVFWFAAGNFPGSKAHTKNESNMPDRARPDGQFLFNRYSSHSVQDQQRQQMSAAINDEDPELIRNGDIDALTKEFAQRFALEVPTLLEGALSVNAQEAQIDVTGDLLYGSFGDKPAYAPGIRVEYYVPFAGERDMWQVKPGMRNISMRPVELRDHELVFAYLRPDQDVGATKEELDREIAQVGQSLQWLANECRAFNASLPAHAEELILARRKRLETMTSQIKNIGVAIRKTVPATPEQARARREKGAGKDEHYDIALSFAGEDRAYVEEVANGLQAAGIKVFYDKFETANLWGKNLIDHLAKIYKSARYVVMFISKDYVAKAWTTHERQHAQERELFLQEEYVLPARFDDTPVPGMTNTVAYQDLRQTTPERLAQLIITKLRS